MKKRIHYIKYDKIYYQHKIASEQGCKNKKAMRGSKALRLLSLDKGLIDKKQKSQLFF